MMRIGVLTVAIGEEYISATWSALKRKAHYCNQHNYGYQLATHRTSNRPPSWEKIPAALSLLRHYDWLFVSDADSLILNNDVWLESFLTDDADLIISRDANALNAGNFLIRSTTWAAEFLQELWNLDQFTHHPWWENAALMHAIDHNPAHMDHIKVVPQNLFNSYVDTYRPGDFLVHFAGTREPAKLEALIADYLEK